MKGKEIIDAIKNCKQNYKSSDKCKDCCAYREDKKMCVKEYEILWEEWNNKKKKEAII